MIKRWLYLLIVFAIYACNPESPNEVILNSNDSLPVALVAETKIVAMPSRFNIGRKATAAEISAWDIDIRPDGKGLPAGEGDARAGRIVYEMKCISCHGKNGEGAAYNRLVGVDDTIKAKTIGNYWPYASTLFDYIRRTMPYTRPGTLTDEEVYGLTAYLLSANKIIDSTTKMNAKTLPKVVMPAQKYFVNDDRRGGPEIR